MRRIVLGLGISIDGYIARLDDAVDFLFMPKDYSMAPFMASVDTAIMGRKTWRAALKMGGSFGGSPMATYVFSRSEPAGERDGLTFVTETPAAFVSRLRERPREEYLADGRRRTGPRFPEGGPRRRSRAWSGTCATWRRDTAIPERVPSA
jgi:dihydrofolate reductase